MERKNRLNIQINKISEDAKSSLKKRIIVGAVIAAVLAPCVILGGWFFLVFILLLIGAATFEIAYLPSRKLSWVVWLVTFIVMYMLVFWVMIKQSYNQDTGKFVFDINTSFTTIGLSAYSLGFMFLLFFFIVALKHKDFTVLDACYLIAMTVVLAIGFQSFLYIRYIPFNHFSDAGIINLDNLTPTFKYAQSNFLIIFLLIGISFNDMGAYFFGVFFGKHKMAPALSPNKTWEGFAGGIVSSVIFSSIFGLVVAHFGMPMLPIFNIKTGWYYIILCSVALPLTGDLGDLAFSAIKRQFNKKDYSHILGPHGGILDRIDSTLFGALVLTMLVTLINNGWDLFA